jgi:hypothetical protein
MQPSNRWILVVLSIASLQLSACTEKSDMSIKSAPAQVERIEGTDLKRVLLTEKAAERLGIKTAPVHEMPVAQLRRPRAEPVAPLGADAGVAAKPVAPLGADAGVVQKVPHSGGNTAEPGVVQVVPYAAVLYDARGNTWVYTNPTPLTFVRHAIHIDYIEGDLAVLSDGPPSGTEVVTVGPAELFGAETGIGK